jgi:hypothetical protein
VATKIFELGLKVFSDNPDYVLRYLGFLISVNDENSLSLLCFWMLLTNELRRCSGSI